MGEQHTSGGGEQSGIDGGLALKDVEAGSVESTRLEGIGERLFVSRNTVKSEVAAIYRKLGVSDRAHAVAVAIRNGLVA